MKALYLYFTFFVMTPLSLVPGSLSFGGICWLQLQCRYYNPEDHNLSRHQSDNTRCQSVL